MLSGSLKRKSMIHKVEFPELPKGIGPHEGRELGLMLAGKKPISMFYEGLPVPVSEVYPEEEFLLHVESGELIRHDEIYRLTDSISAHYVFYALPGETWRFRAMRQLLQARYVERRAWTENDERAIGLLLGYSESEISAWLDWIRAKGPLSEVAKID
jgi:hypothetical protein